ncbi:MAG: glycosyltransferase N-terminal domain-containing protein [Pseudomonadota bacterium]
MARSLGLAAYRAMTRRGEAQYDADGIERPAGSLIWMHAGEPGNILALKDLAKRAKALDPTNTILVTQTDKMRRVRLEKEMILASLPSEHPQAVAAFLQHWQPDICVWTWGNLRPNLLLEAAEQSCTCLLIDADASGFEQSQGKWLPAVTRRVLGTFDKICCRSTPGLRRLRALGAVERSLEQTPPLLAGGFPPPVLESDLAELSSAMGGRPAWFASEVVPEELSPIFEAHKMAMRLSHRLLLILQPARPQTAEAAIRLAEAQGMNFAAWDEGEYPDESTQLLIATDARDRGLFFRVAPVSFLGTTLVSGADGADPLDAAALGSAVLYGPRVREFLPSYSRLAAAGAARIVNDAETLGSAVSRLIAPDQAATMAHAGWDVISQGAALTDRVLQILQDTLDAKDQQR